MTDADWDKLKEINNRLTPTLNESVGVYNLGLTIYTNYKLCRMAMGYKRVCPDACTAEGFKEKMRAYYLEHKEDLDTVNGLLHPAAGPDWFEAYMKKVEGDDRS